MRRIKLKYQFLFTGTLCKEREHGWFYPLPTVSLAPSFTIHSFCEVVGSNVSIISKLPAANHEQRAACSDRNLQAARSKERAANSGLRTEDSKLLAASSKRQAASKQHAVGS